MKFYKSGGTQTQWASPARLRTLHRKRGSEQGRSRLHVVMQFEKVARASRPWITRKMRVPPQTASLPRLRAKQGLTLRFSRMAATEALTTSTVSCRRALDLRHAYHSGRPLVH